MRASVILAAATAVCIACISPPLEPREREARIQAGAEWFEGRCSLCHGSAADGRGPVAPHLKTRPADLTRIAERNGGIFDSEAVAAFIDGRARIQAHGSSEMPVWQDIASGSSADATRLDPRAVLLIVEFLESVQEP